jgi:hypothetical protein
VSDVGQTLVSKKELTAMAAVGLSRVHFREQLSTENTDSAKEALHLFLSHTLGILIDCSMICGMLASGQQGMQCPRQFVKVFVQHCTLGRDSLTGIQLQMKLQSEQKLLGLALNWDQLEYLEAN